MPIPMDIQNPATIEMVKLRDSIEQLDPDTEDKVFDMVGLVVAENRRLMDECVNDFACKLHLRKAHKEGKRVVI